MFKFTPGTILRFKFNTRKADGTLITLAGSPAVVVYKDSSTVESSAGVTLTVDFDGRTGLHHLTIDTTADPTFYSSGMFQAVLSAGTVDGVSVANHVVEEFALSNDPTIFADALLTRSVSNVENAAPEHSLTSVVLTMLEWAIDNGVLTVYKTDGTTPYFTKSVTTNVNARPVIKVE